MIRRENRFACSSIKEHNGTGNIQGATPWGGRERERERDDTEKDSLNTREEKKEAVFASDFLFL